MGEDGNRMIDREALAAAVQWVDREVPWPIGITSRVALGDVLEAARERLAQLPEKCGTCKGTGSTFDDPNCYACTCPICHSKGVLYPPALVERIEMAVGFALMDSGLDVNGRWSKEKSRSFAVAVLDALNDWKPE